MNQKEQGFTIVELLIVIVVIAILAAITIVSYNGIVNNARYTTYQADIAAVDKAIQLYYVDNGTYPFSGTMGGNTGASATSLENIPGLTPKYLNKAPTFPAGGVGYYVYIWTEGGADYKLVRLVNTASQLPNIEKSNARPDTYRTGRGWGTWSPGGSGL
jgi:general secretion pathway protein G